MTQPNFNRDGIEEKEWNDVVYELHSVWNDKDMAKLEAKFARKMGLLARVAPTMGRFGVFAAEKR